MLLTQRYLIFQNGDRFPCHVLGMTSRKMFVMLYTINWRNFIAWLPLLLEILGNMCIGIVCYPACEVIIFNLLIKWFFHITKKSKQNIKIFWERKEFLRWNEKHCSSFLKLVSAIFFLKFLFFDQMIAL